MIKSEDRATEKAVRSPERSTKRELRKVQTRIHETNDPKSLANVPYRKKISTSMALSLSQRILYLLEEKKIYKDSTYTAKQMAVELQTNTRYLSAVVNTHFKKTYSSLVNEYRIKDAVALLADRSLRGNTIEEISAMVGFANRQSFYAAFSKYVGETPHSFRKRFL